MARVCLRSPEEELLDVGVTGAEACLGVGKIQVPHTAEDTVEAQCRHLFPTGVEPLAPQPQRFRVMRPEPVLFEQPKSRMPGGNLPYRLHRRNDPAREDVL